MYYSTAVRVMSLLRCTDMDIRKHIRRRCVYINSKCCGDEPVTLKSVLFILCNTIKPVLSFHSKIDKTMIIMTNSSLMKVESIAED